MAPRGAARRLARGRARAADLTNAFVEGAARVLEASEDERPPPRRGQAPRQPDPDPRRRRPPPAPRADPRPIRSDVGLLRRDAGRARHRARPRDGARRCATPRSRPAPGRRPRRPTRPGRVWHPKRCKSSRLSTCISRDRTCPAHDGRCEDKRDVVTSIDRAFFGEVAPEHRSGPDRRGRSRPTTQPPASGRPTRPSPCPCSSRADPSHRTVRTLSGSATARRGRSGTLLGPQILPRVVELVAAG